MVYACACARQQAQLDAMKVETRYRAWLSNKRQAQLDALNVETRSARASPALRTPILVPA